MNARMLTLTILMLRMSAQWLPRHTSILQVQFCHCLSIFFIYLLCLWYGIVGVSVTTIGFYLFYLYEK